MNDILYTSAHGIFSYRVAGICIHDGKVLLHRSLKDEGYAFPGGHVSFGETTEETLVREFEEETGAEIRVRELRWIMEIFFTLSGKPCHQICMFYSVDIVGNMPLTDKFFGIEHTENDKYDIEFRWVPLEKLSEIKIYPEKTAELLRDTSGIKHFVCRE